MRLPRLTETLRFAFSIRGRVGRLPYLACGIGFTTVKFALDCIVARAFGRSWSPVNYLAPSQFYSIWAIPQADRPFYATLVLLSLPFIGVGVTLTIRRLRDAALPLWLAVLFFVPALNIIFLLILAAAPARWPEWVNAPRDPATPGRKADWTLISAFVSSAVSFGLVAFSVNVLRNYGWGLFFGVPFLQGLLAAVIMGFRLPESLGGCIGAAALSIVFSAIGLIVLKQEGAGCLIMAAPIAIVLAVLGAVVGCAIQRESPIRPRRGDTVFSMAILVPAAMLAEAVLAGPAPTRVVQSAVIVNAPAEKVWGNVISFPELRPPDELLFRAGIAYPMRGHIEGTGAGAIRYCEFSTGPFIEPIKIWDAPHRLQFGISDQPPPMRELSPYSDVHPPHLDSFLQCEKGEFLLTSLPDGKTLLQGSTWYNQRIRPQFYWSLWTDLIIHRIHMRVLNHIKVLSE